MKVKITSDMGEVYDGRTMEVKELVNDYIDCLNDVEDAETITFLQTVDENTALKFIKDMWGLKYEVIS